jgi:hypothetical protein
LIGCGLCFSMSKIAQNGQFLLVNSLASPKRGACEIAPTPLTRGDGVIRQSS